nr:SAV_915 family protein [Halopolyspora algeriensis]
MPGNVLAIMAYTSEAALRQGCGPHQAAAPVPAGLLGDVRRQCGAHTICLDTPLPQRLRHGGEE